MYEFELENEQKTLRLGYQFGQSIKKGCIVYLEGELGSGKTTFVRGVLSGLGYNGKVKSPTYTIVESYDLGRCDIYHFDLYRLADPEELEYLGIRDYFTANSLILVEWPGKGQGFIPVPDVVVYLKYLTDGRNLTIIPKSEKGEQLLHKIDMNDKNSVN